LTPEQEPLAKRSEPLFVPAVVEQLPLEPPNSELNPLPRKLSGYVYKCTVRSRLVIDRWVSAFAKKKPQEPSEPPANEGESRERDPLDGSDGFKAHHFASRARSIAGLATTFDLVPGNGKSSNDRLSLSHCGQRVEGASQPIAENVLGLRPSVPAPK
jgi:hypothetical protein